MDLSNLVNLLLYLFLVSALSEKVTQNVKHLLHLDNATSKVKRNIVAVLTFAVALGSAYTVPPEGIFMLGKLPFWIGVVVVAFLGSSGSAVWHDMITLIYQYKENQKALLADPNAAPTLPPAVDTTVPGTVTPVPGTTTRSPSADTTKPIAALSTVPFDPNVNK